MSYLALAIVEMIGMGITVHSYDTGDYTTMLGGVVYIFLFLVWGMAAAIQETAAQKKH